MKVLIVGGSGHVGAALIRYFSAQNHEIVVLSRSSISIPGVRVVTWNGRHYRERAQEINGCDVVINLAGRSVNCRYTPAHLKEMYESRTRSTQLIGQAISNAKSPPKVWLQASTATIYAHRFDAANDEYTGIIGGNEQGVPRHWKLSVAIAEAWEKTLAIHETPSTRKVALRSAMTMSIDKGSVFDVLQKLAKRGLGGPLAGGKQYVSWIHETDFCRAIDFLIHHEEMDGPVNICSPNPLPQREFMKILRQAVGVRFGLPANKWMVEIGTRLMSTESELILKSRRVVPTRLLQAGFDFQFPNWQDAAADLVARSKSSA